MYVHAIWSSNSINRQLNLQFLCIHVNPKNISKPKPYKKAFNQIDKASQHHNLISSCCEPRPEASRMYLWRWFSSVDQKKLQIARDFISKFSKKANNHHQSSTIQVNYYSSFPSSWLYILFENDFYWSQSNFIHHKFKWSHHSWR